MSNLELNVPITFDAAAALDISYNITQRVQDAEGQMASFEQSAEGFNMFTSYLGEQKSGLTITNNDIILSANKTYIKTPGSNAETLFQNGKIKTDYISADTIEAKTLKTIGGTGEVDIRNGIIKCSGSQNNSEKTEIEFGVDVGGDAILKFKINGTTIYNLGPRGLIMLNVHTEENKFINVGIETPIIYPINNSSSTKLYITSFSTNIYSFDDTTTPKKLVLSAGTDTSEICKFKQINNIIPYNTSINAYMIALKLNDLEEITNCYRYEAGYKQVQNQIQYNDTQTSDPPITHLKLFKTTSANVSNYVNDGYYITGDPYPSDMTLPLENRYDVDIYNSGTAGYAYPLYILDRSTGDEISDKQYIWEDTTFIKVFEIYNVINGIDETSHTIYGFECIDNTLLSKRISNNLLVSDNMPIDDCASVYDAINNKNYSQIYQNGDTFGSLDGAYIILCSPRGAIYYTPYSINTNNINDVLADYLSWLNEID